MSNGQSPDRKQVALIAGPTASGKSDLAVELAISIEQHGGSAVVINADSSQVYRDLSILSARPTLNDMRGIEHRLFGTWDGATPCSAADWAAAARREVENAHLDGRVPVLVGGTGLYIRTLLDGIAPVPAIDPAIREEIRALPADAAYHALLNEDPARAAALNIGDTARIARSLEVIRSTGRSLAYWQTKHEGGIGGLVNLFPLLLLPDRAELFSRCDLRFTQMIEQGAVEEVTRLLARDLSPDLPVMRAIGVPEIAGWLHGEWSKEDAIAQAQQATRRYAKRQYTWFSRQCPPSWPRLSDKPYDWRTYFEIILRTQGLT